MPDESTRLRMRTAHSHQGYRCSCGKEVSGNGGMTSHRKACDGYYLTWGDAYEARRARLSDTPAAPTTPEARILLMKRLNAILDDRWPLTGKIMAAVDEYAAARFTPAEALRAALKAYDKHQINGPELADSLRDWLARSTPAEPHDPETSRYTTGNLEPTPRMDRVRSTPAEALREALEHVLDVWPAPSPEEFARLHRVLTGHDSCSPHNREADHE